MTRSTHAVHKLLLVGLLLVLFTLPFVLSHADTTDLNALRAGAGVLQTSSPSAQSSQTNSAAAIGQSAGATLAKH